MEIVRRSPGLDLAFIDKNLPGMDGIETFKGIKSTRS